MDFRFTEEQERFRQEVRDFLHRELPSDWPFNGRLAEESDEWWDFTLSWLRKLGGKGWIALTWPEEYGGKGRPLMDEVILSEEMAYRRTPGVQVWARWKMVAPIIMGFGSEEQKRRHLPGIAKGEVTWCEGFSEPGAGSDLAGVQTQAIEDGDNFVINGQKIFTSLAHRADYCFLAARTDPDAPKHRGISMFVVDMKAPGITIRPLINIVGSHHFNEVFFDDVRVTKKDLIGEKNRGWYYLATALNYERSGVTLPAMNKRLIEELARHAKETPGNGGMLADDLMVRQKLAEMAIENEISRLLCYRVAWLQSKGLVPSYEASMSLLFGGELIRRIANTGMEILGLYGQLTKKSKWAPLRGTIEHLYLSSLSAGIAGGTNEIQRNLIAILGLGLPRG